MNNGELKQGGDIFAQSSTKEQVLESASITPFEVKTEDQILRYCLENPRMVPKNRNGETVLAYEGEFWADSDAVLDPFKNEILKLALDYNYNIRFFAILSHLWYHPELVEKIYDEERIGLHKDIQQMFGYLKNEYFEEVGMKKKVTKRR